MCGSSGDAAAERPRRRRGADREGSKENVIVIPPAPEHSIFVFGFHEDRNAPRRRKMEVLLLYTSPLYNAFSPGRIHMHSVMTMAE